MGEVTSTTTTEIIFLVEELPEGGWLARALDHGIVTEADDLDGLKAAVREAVRCHFEGDAPRIIRLHIVRDEVIPA